MQRYPLIADHGLVGDLQTAAVISSEGVVDWYAAPRFDSPGIFSALLDHDVGGHFSLGPDTPDGTSKQLYYPGTAVLVTRFMSPDGVGELMDWMPPLLSPTPSDRHALIRVLRCMRGTIRFRLECAPRFDFGRDRHILSTDEGPGSTREGRGSAREGRAVFRGARLDAHLQATFPLRRQGDDVDGTVVLNAGETAGVALTVCDAGGEAPEPIAVDGLTERLWQAIRFWQGWVRTTRYAGRWPDMVHRAAITLKLLTYLPTGAPIAAATMGLPEQVGGERNWDYRYTWIRDGSLSVRALLDLGFVEEATAFTDWLMRRLSERADLPHGPGGTPLQIMYRVDGDPDLPEEMLGHLEGYRRSAPVRVGNAAKDQLQLDIYGEALYALAQGRGAHGPDDGPGLSSREWKAVARVLDELTTLWDQPDDGIWETRGGRQDFTFSRVMSWVAFDRGLRLADRLSWPADVARWRTARDTVFTQVMEKGWHSGRRAFVQHYEDDVLDSSLLLAPRVGFASPTDPDWLSTLDAMESSLVSDSLVYRYDPHASPDGLRGSEGTFSLCSFLWVDAVARAGCLEQARFAFEKMLTYANHVGLFAEEIGPTGEQLGNFPQAFTHLALIMAATTLDDALDRLVQGRAPKRRRSTPPPHLW
ncbi:glycoside hydrolase family 15 protein [Streptomyces sp. ISL-10]|uniref:glycoside hydrolase family 15 protein n=1 Tax=Streptomyces sp. ISL-10 TaxID=2819172 RepID=UPI001BEB3277|nr:glycoside hydrolase family 15 protein [Streptomyces sp. ISL-10]MBT2365803.1 glycoside hydrolase family 15 protein [Streptomyces sp. ISL-10]